jgi:hypothetical protein
MISANALNAFTAAIAKKRVLASGNSCAARLAKTGLNRRQGGPNRLKTKNRSGDYEKQD